MTIIMCHLHWLTYDLVLLQAMKNEPPLDARCRDKFLVQSVALTADKEFTNIAQIVSILWHGWAEAL